MTWKQTRPVIEGSGHGGGAELARRTVCSWDGLEVKKKNVWEGGGLKGSEGMQL